MQIYHRNTRERKKEIKRNLFFYFFLFLFIYFNVIPIDWFQGSLFWVASVYLVRRESWPVFEALFFFVFLYQISSSHLNIYISIYLSIRGTYWYILMAWLFIIIIVHSPARFKANERGTYTHLHLIMVSVFSPAPRSFSFSLPVKKQQQAVWKRKKKRQNLNFVQSARAHIIIFFSRVFIYTNGERKEKIGYVVCPATLRVLPLHHHLFSLFFFPQLVPCGMHTLTLLNHRWAARALARDTPSTLYADSRWPPLYMQTSAFLMKNSFFFLFSFSNVFFFSY